MAFSSTQKTRASMHESAAPESQIIDAVLRMRRGGRTLQDVLHYVRLAWEHEAH